MILPPEDGELFYKLMSGVQYHINLHTGTLKGVKSPDDFARLAPDKRAKVRELMWKRPEMMDEYIEANPDSFPDQELEILRGWKSRFLKSTFYIFRHLKKGTLFIGDKDQVYSVVALKTPFEELFPEYVLPQMVQAVLLPFKGMIIYDGLFSSYPLIIGRNICANLNHIYQVAKHKDRIIYNLEPDLTPAVSESHLPSSRLIAQFEELTSGLSAIKGDTTIQNAALSLARASLELAVATAKGEDLGQSRKKVRRTSTRLQNLLDIEAEE